MPPESALQQCGLQECLAPTLAVSFSSDLKVSTTPSLGGKATKGLSVMRL